MSGALLEVALGGMGPTLSVAGAVAPSALLRVEADGVLIQALADADVVVAGSTTTVTGSLAGSGLHATWTAAQVGTGPVWELGLRLRNDASAATAVTLMDPATLALEPGTWTTLWFRSGWGSEYSPERGFADHHLRLDVRSGRSCHGAVPWMGLERTDAAGAVASGLVVAPAWSGNWHVDVLGDRVDAGVSPWLFRVDLAPGDEVTAPSVVVAVGDDVDDAACALSRAVGEAWIPRSAASQAMPTEWNHWWPYEDQDVTQDVVLRNADRAARLGLEVSTVDAGWFGAADGASDWQEQRGDWDLVNTARFPDGLKHLGDGIRAAGTQAGIWIEAEAVGKASRLAAEHPEILARAPQGRRPDPSYGRMTVSVDAADPGFLGYVCLGSPGGREHVARSLHRVVEETGAHWVKLDFNIDPDAGCGRTDHGHGAGDGLLRHYEGLYAVLDGFRERHPEVVLEACSSGGLRMDLGLARHVHCMFLSDPDQTEHHLQVMWGAGLHLPPAALLHFSWSQWRGDYPPAQRDWDAITADDFDTTLRAVMLHRFAVSLKLVDLRAELTERLRAHVEAYRGCVGTFVRDGVLRRLTAQPLRSGRGERRPAFQLSLPAEDRHVVAAFSLPGATSAGDAPAVRLQGLRPDVTYRLTPLAGTASSVLPPTADGAGLTDEGLAPDDGTGPTSWLFLVEKA